MSKYSYGIACARFNANINKYEMLLVEKRYTYAYSTFVSGLYKKSILQQLFNNMTREEKKYILSGVFELVYFHFSLKKRSELKLIDEILNYNRMRRAYENISQEELANYVNNTRCETRIWEFPKGRMNSVEGSTDCAIREFEEETGMRSSQYTIISDTPFKIEFSDFGKNYTYYLYIAVCDMGSCDLSFKTDESTNNEIANINWINSEISKYYLKDKFNLAFKSILKIIKLNKKTNDFSQRKITKDRRKITIEKRIQPRC